MIKIKTMDKILKDYLDNDEALDCWIDSKTTYLSLMDVEILLKRQKDSILNELEIDVTRCPKCNSTDHLMIIGKPYKCMDCNNEWV